MREGIALNHRPKRRPTTPRSLRSSGACRARVTATNRVTATCTPAGSEAIREHLNAAVSVKRYRALFMDA
jgi:hypothetical protein